jgi:hypothetical protein
MKYAELPGIAPVTNIKAVQGSNNNIVVTWNAPVSISSYRVIFNYDGKIDTLKNNAVSDTIVNPVVNIEHAITVKVNTPDGKVSDGVTTRITVAGPNPVSNFLGARDLPNSSIVLTWALPETSTATQIEISYGGKVITVPATSTSYTVSNVVATQKYTFAIRTKTATASSNYVYTSVGSVKYAYLTYFKSLSDLQQNGNNEEIAAVNWFVKTYPSGDVISTYDIQNKAVNLSQYSVVWINIDNTITDAVPAQLENSTVLSQITTYYQTGGSLLLTTFATQYVVDLGRTTRKPSIIGAGSAGFNGDIWDANIIIGAGQPTKYDYTNSPLFAGLTMDNTSFTWATVPLEGSGLKENHNSMWDLNSYGYKIPADGDNVVRAFEIENNATVMATWGQVADYCCGGIIYFNPTAAYPGKCIAIGLSAYEFNQSSGVAPYTCSNVYQANIEKLTQNAISFLQ